MALKGRKLHPDGIHGIRGFAMAYNGPATLAMTYKELAQEHMTIGKLATKSAGVSYTKLPSFFRHSTNAYGN
jgi:hypothetical protein